jgi:hypothetical protein
MLELLLTLAIVGFVAWLITTLVPMDPKIKQVIIGVAILLIVVFVIRALFGDIPVPRIR